MTSTTVDVEFDYELRWSIRCRFTVDHESFYLSLSVSLVLSPYPSLFIFLFHQLCNSNFKCLARLANRLQSSWHCHNLSASLCELDHVFLSKYAFWIGDDRLNEYTHSRSNIHTCKTLQRNAACWLLASEKMIAFYVVCERNCFSVSYCFYSPSSLSSLSTMNCGYAITSAEAQLALNKSEQRNGKKE